MPNSQWLEILIAAMVAGLVLFRLYTVLGRRTGHQASPPVQRLPQTQQRLAPPEARPEQGGSGLLDIQLADSHFDTDAFLSGARNAYQIISTAFEKADRAQLQPLLGPDVYAAFDAAITARDQAPLIFAGLKETRIVAASLEQKEAQITLAFTADFTAADGATRAITDVWTFARRLDAADPNWTLIATTGDLPG